MTAPTVGDDAVWGDEWDDVADVVVVGSGAAGGAAAATAATRGASVLVLEAAGLIGGTTAKSGGVMWIPNNPIMQAAGTRDERPDALRYLARTVYPVQFDPSSPTLGLTTPAFELLEAFYDHGAEAVAALADAGAFELTAVDYPDYWADLPENAAPQGRTVQPRFPDDWQRNVDPTGGQLLTDGLIHCAQDHGALVRLDHRVVHVVRNSDGVVVGVEARTGVRTVLFGARRGVIFASGGFLHDGELTRSFLRGPVFGGGAVDTAVGDFVRIGLEVAASLGNMSHAWWDQVAVEHAVAVPSTIKDVYSPFGDSMLMVNRHGHRVVNEKAVYNERSQAHFVWDPTRGDYPNLLLFMIFDDAVVQNPEPSRFRWPVPMPDEQPLPFVFSADDLTSLAVEIRARLERLAPHTGRCRLAENFDEQLHAAVDRFNTMAAAGRDVDFGRGQSSIERKWAGAPRAGAASAAMYPLSPSGPYHCVILGPGRSTPRVGP